MSNHPMMIQPITLRLKLSSKIQMMKIGMGLLSHIEPILQEIAEIKENPTHGKQELIEGNEKFFAIYREQFDSETDAQHFVNFYNRVCAISKDQLPPVQSMVILFKSLLPIIQPKEMRGKQSHGKPDLKKTESGKFVVILKEVFTDKDDAVDHLREADNIKSMRL